MVIPVVRAVLEQPKVRYRPAERQTDSKKRIRRWRKVKERDKKRNTGEMEEEMVAKVD